MNALKEHSIFLKSCANTHAYTNEHSQTSLKLKHSHTSKVPRTQCQNWICTSKHLSKACLYTHSNIMFTTYKLSTNDSQVATYMQILSNSPWIQRKSAAPLKTAIKFVIWVCHRRCFSKVHNISYECIRVIKWRGWGRGKGGVGGGRGVGSGVSLSVGNRPSDASFTVICKCSSYQQWEVKASSAIIFWQ